MLSPRFQKQSWIGRASLVALAAATVAAAAPALPVSAQDVEPAIVTASAAVELHVGPGQQHGSLQAAIDAIPGSITSSYRILVHPGTYSGETVLQGKSLAGGSVLIENAEETKPLFTGATSLTGSNWGPTSYADVWFTGRGGVLGVTDRERLVHVASLAELARTPNAWYGDSSATYVHLFDGASPNTRSIALLHSSHGFRSVGVAVTLKGLRFEHYAGTGVWLQSAPGSSLQSVWTSDVGNRGADDAGILLSGSGSTSVVNPVVSQVRGSGVRISSSSGVHVLNGSFFNDTFGVSLVSSPSALIQNNAFGLGFEAALKTDAASESGMVSRDNVYGNVSGLTGERNGSPYENPQAGAGGEAESQLADPKFRSTTSAYPYEVSWLLDRMHDQDQGNNGGNGWATDTDASHLAWDWGFLGKAYMEAYRATGDVNWLEKIVSQSDQIWAQAYDNPSSPGAAADGKLGWSTSRYSVALVKPSTPVSSGGADIRVVDSTGAVLGAGEAVRVYGPGNGDTIASKVIELRFGVNPDVRYEIWDATGVTTCVGNCGMPADNYSDGVFNGNMTDGTVDALASYPVTWQIATAAPASGDIYRITTKAKKQLEYSNIDARVAAPMADFAAMVMHDPSIQQLPVAGSTMLAKAQDYLAKISTHIFDKWHPYFRDLPATPGNNGSPGGIYVYPSDEQYALPSNTNPLNMQADMGRLWAHMYSATGEPKYSWVATKLAQFVQSKLTIKTRNGQEYYDWLYYNQSGSWDTWNQPIAEDINHGGLVADFANVMREVGLVFTESDLVRFRNTFTANVWDPGNNRIFYYFDRTVPLAYSGAVYWLHDWMDLPGGESVAKLVQQVYSTSSYSTTTGVVYQTLTDAALKLARVPGAQNYGVRSGSPAIKVGTTTPYDFDFNARSRAELGAFDVGAYAFVPLTRLAGSNRYSTAIEISKNRFATSGSAGGAVLTRGDVFADGLAGAPLAAAKNATVLLTKPTALPDGVLAELQRAVPAGGTVWILGGGAAVSQEVADAIVQAGFVVERIEGPNRYATAAAIAAKLGQVTEVFIANGTSFADPLAASAAAVSRGAAILLAKTSSLPQEAADYLTTNGQVTAHLVGGTTVLDKDLSLAVQALVTWTDRFGGSNRYGTAKLLAEGFFPGASAAGFATGTNFPDSMVAGALLGSSQVAGPLLLVKTDSVPKEVSDYLSANGANLMDGYIFGGVAAVSQAVEDTLESSL